MTPKNLAERLYIDVVLENLNLYKDLFETTEVDKTKDAYWSQSLIFFQKLTPEDQKVFFEIIRQVMVDTTSNILGVIDGTNVLNLEAYDLNLLANGTPLNGDLQSLFHSQAYGQ